MEAMTKGVAHFSSTSAWDGDDEKIAQNNYACPAQRWPMPPRMKTNGALSRRGMSCLCLRPDPPLQWGLRRTAGRSHRKCRAVLHRTSCRRFQPPQRILSPKRKQKKYTLEEVAAVHFAEINRIREEQGLSLLESAPTLTEMAQERIGEYRWGHKWADGSTGTVYRRPDTGEAHMMQFSSVDNGIIQGAISKIDLATGKMGETQSFKAVHSSVPGAESFSSHTVPVRDPSGGVYHVSTKVDTTIFSAANKVGTMSGSSYTPDSSSKISATGNGITTAFVPSGDAENTGVVTTVGGSNMAGPAPASAGERRRYCHTSSRYERDSPTRTFGRTQYP